MSARPPRSAAALLAALALILISSMPADAAVRQHRHHARKIARWHVGHGHKHRHRPVRGVNGAGHGSTGTSAAGAQGTAGQPHAQSSAAQQDPKFGVYTDGAPYSGNVDSVDRLQNALGRHVDIVNWYQNWAAGSWAEQFHPEVVGAVVQSGRTPLLTWEPWDPAAGADQPQFRLRRIVDGDFDAYIASW